MHLYLLENPSAGRGRASQFLADLQRALIQAGHRVTRFVGERPGDLSRQVASLGPDDLDRLVIAGGDGTFRAILNAGSTLPPWPVGIVPAGTANLVAREAGTLPRKPAETLARDLVEARPWPIDILEMRRDDAKPVHALTNVGIGIDGAIVHAVSRVRSEGHGGYSKWIRPILGAVSGGSLEPLRVRVDGAEPIECMSAVIQNTLCYGGLFRLSPDARLDSRRFSVVTLHANTNLDLARLGVRAGLRSVHRDRQVRIVEGRHVRLSSAEPLAVQADGDPAGFTDLDVRLKPGALRLIRVGGTAQGRDA